jgi:hypothetical protein
MSIWSTVGGEEWSNAKQLDALFYHYSKDFTTKLAKDAC